MSTSAQVTHVSDTALWVAALRAREGQRKAPLFRDPLALLLAGERGEELGKRMPGQHLTAWVMALRTQALDRLILRSIELGCDTIVNLGAGLDTRPYRLPLPATLRWIEVDFPTIIDLKNDKLKNERPNCSLERVALDLNDEAARHKKLTELLTATKQVAVLTEGLLIYLTPEQVSSLAAELRSQPSVRFWLQDYIMGRPPGTRRRQMDRVLQHAPWLFEVKDWFGYFSERGFLVAENILLTDEVKRLRRLPPGWPFFALKSLFSSRRQREFQRKQAGWVMLEKRAM